MSLTQQLRTANSPVNRWFNQNTDDESIKHFVKTVNDKLAKAKTLPLPYHEQYALVGTAFEYSFRWLMGDITAEAAKSGARACQRHFNWQDAPTIADTVIQDGNRTRYNRRKRIACAVVLAWFERVYRSGEMPPELQKTQAQASTAAAVQVLYDQVSAEVVDDIFILTTSASKLWKDDFQKNFTLNPTFTGSADIAADGDWILEHTLYDSKCTRKERPFRRYEVLQMLGYVLLDYQDAYKLNEVGWYYARQESRLTFGLKKFIKEVGLKDDLATSRENFGTMLRGGK